MCSFARGVRLSLYCHSKETKYHFCCAVCCNIDSYDIDNDSGNDVGIDNYTCTIIYYINIIIITS